jgi:hypothetical protein
VSIEIKNRALGQGLQEFLDIADLVYADDPKFVRPLDFELKGRLSKSNPYFEHAEATLFVAYKDGKPVGRASAQIDHAWNERYREKSGFFGFFDTIEDQEVATALLRAAENYLRDKGMERIIGPMSLNSNEEMGCLIDGFDTPPMVMMPHHRRYQGALIEGAGYKKLKDVYAWKYVVAPLPRRAKEAYEAIRALPEVTARHIDKSNLSREVELVMDIFNDAWSENWGFVPLSKSELKKLAEDFKLLLVPELTYIVSIDGEPAAFAIAVPNMNEHMADLRGKLFPTGALKLLWRLKVLETTTARLALLGVRKKFRGVKKYGALSTYMYAELTKSGQRLGITWGELSWTLEDNHPVNLAIKFMGGRIYKTYRVYEKPLESA